MNLEDQCQHGANTSVLPCVKKKKHVCTTEASGVCLHCRLQRAGTQFVTRRAQTHAARPIRETLLVQSPIPLPDRAGHNDDLALEASEERTEQRASRSSTSIPTKGSGQVVWQAPKRSTGCTAAFFPCTVAAPISCFFRAPRPRAISILVVCPVDRAHLIPWLGRTQSGCPGKPAQPSVDSPRM